MVSERTLFGEEYVVEIKKCGYGRELIYEEDDLQQVIEGQFFDGKLYGKGRVFLSTGEFYEGGFRAGLKQGYGVFKWPNGNKYVGDWKDNIHNGHGEFYHADFKEKFIGNFVGGKIKLVTDTKNKEGILVSKVISENGEVSKGSNVV